VCASECRSPFVRLDNAKKGGDGEGSGQEEEEEDDEEEGE
jgi:hypothetical protein